MRRGDRPIAELRNLGAATARLLAEIGVRGEADLRRLGAAEAFRRLRFATGRAVSRNALYAMHAALIDCDWRDVPASVKADLEAAAGLSAVTSAGGPRGTPGGRR